MTPRKKVDPEPSKVVTHHEDPERDVTAVAAVVDPIAQEKVAGPVPATIVSDRRDTRMKRLAQLGLIVLVVILLGWIVNGIRENNRRLHNAERERTLLIKDVNTLAQTMENEGDDLTQLRLAIIEQNKVLRATGHKTIPVPPLTSQQPQNQPQPAQQQSARTSPRPTSHPGHPSPHPSPTPSQPVQICLPVVGCVPNSTVANMSADQWRVILIRLFYA